MGRTLYDKIFDAHVVRSQTDGTVCSTSIATS
jgi:homoaconitase/3-isopropylmalate dehydratase large subunit